MWYFVTVIHEICTTNVKCFLHVLLNDLISSLTSVVNTKIDTINGDTYIDKDSNYVTVHLILRNSTIPTDPKVVSIGDASIIPPNYKVYRATLTDATQTIMPVECTCTIDPEGFITVHTYGDTSGLTDVWLFLEVVYSLF